MNRPVPGTSPRSGSSGTRSAPDDAEIKFSFSFGAQCKDSVELGVTVTVDRAKVSGGGVPAVVNVWLVLVVPSGPTHT